MLSKEDLEEIRQKWAPHDLSVPHIVIIKHMGLLFQHIDTLQARLEAAEKERDEYKKALYALCKYHAGNDDESEPQYWLKQVRNAK